MSDGALLGVMLVAVMASLVHWLCVKLRRLDGRIRELEKTAVRRHTNATAAGVEDALAVNLDLVRMANEAELELSVLRQRAGQQAEILKLVRSGPHAYDEERAAGRRPSSSTLSGRSGTSPLQNTGEKEG